MSFQKLYFENSQGVRLAARLDLPVDEKPLAYAIFAHCFTCTKNFNAVVNIDKALARERIAVMRFDFTGLGESEGDFSETNFSTNVSDLIAAAEFLGVNFEAPQILIGHSLGGAAVIQAALRISSVRAVATIAAPYDISHMARLLEGSREEMETRGEARIGIGGRTFLIRKQFLDNLGENRMQDTLRNLRKPLLIFHSPLDTVVSIDNAAQIFQAARHPKSFVSLDHADHLLSDREDSLYVGRVLAAWARKYLNAPREAIPHRDVSDNRVAVRTGRKGFQTEILAGVHSLIADEPIAAGGADTGPTPYDYVVAGLGACTSMTLRMYADRKGWPLEAVAVRLDHRKIHADDCRGCVESGDMLDHIDREIEVVGNLSPEQKRRLLEIADRCPVHRTLQSKIRVETRLKE